MGHLINPVAFRLSFFKSWEDNWFVRNVYYPEFLNSMLKLRNYLYFFLTSKKILKSGFFLSSFCIIKYNKIYFINIFLYHIDFEKLSYGSMNRIYSAILNYRWKRFDYKKESYKAIMQKKAFYKRSFGLLKNNVDFFIFIVFFYKIFYKENKKKNKKKLILLNFLNLNKFFKLDSFNSYYKAFFDRLNNKLSDKLFYSNRRRMQILNKLKEDEFIRDSKAKEEQLKKLATFGGSLESLEIENKLCFKNAKKEKKYEKRILSNLEFKADINLYLNMNFKYHRHDKDFLVSNLSLFELIVYLLKKINLNFKSKFKLKISRFIKLIFFLNIFKYLEYKPLKKKMKTNYSFLLFFFSTLLKSFIINIKKGNSIYKKNKVRNKVYHLLYSYLGYRFFFKELKIVTFFFNGIFYIFNKIKNVSYKFFFLSNKNITARWLCRYIGLRLKNNYKFFSVIGPVKRELYKLCRLPWKSNKRKIKVNNFIKLIKNNAIKYKLKFKSFISDIFLLYVIEFNLYYIKNNNYINDFYIYKVYKNKSLLGKVKFLKIYKYIYMNILLSFYWGLSFLKKSKLINSIVGRVYNILLVNLESKLMIKLTNFSAFAFFIKSFLNFNYFKYLWIQLKRLNYRDLRNNSIIKPRSILLGYKLLFKGRFSRKQRASYTWHMRGKMPLNTLSIKLDYFFFTIPLKNSAISVKITLYKSLHYEKFKYLLSF